MYSYITKYFMALIMIFFLSFSLCISLFLSRIQERPFNKDYAFDRHVSEVIISKDLGPVFVEIICFIYRYDWILEELIIHKI